MNSSTLVRLLACGGCGSGTPSVRCVAVAAPSTGEVGPPLCDGICSPHDGGCGMRCRPAVVATLLGSWCWLVAAPASIADGATLAVGYRPRHVLTMALDEESWSWWASAASCSRWAMVALPLALWRERAEGRIPIPMAEDRSSSSSLVFGSRFNWWCLSSSCRVMYFLGRGRSLLC